ncbi:MAG: acyl-CoA dehydrogenase family protein [Thermoplasmata archaeon]
MTPFRALPPCDLEDEIRSFVDAHALARRSAELDERPEFPRAEFREMGALRLLGLRTPTELGGRGLSLAVCGAALFHLAYRSGTTFAKLALQPEFSSVLAEHGSSMLVERFFRPLVRGELLVGNHITEPGAGSDLRGLSLVAEKIDGHYTLNGVKSEAAFATDADAAIVYGRVLEKGKASELLTAFLVPQDLEGITRHSSPDLGERWMRRGSVRYENVELSEDFRIGEEGHGLEYVKSELVRERALLAAIYLGVGRASWEETVEHARERNVLGKPLSRQQAVRFPLVEDGVHLEAAWLFTARALAELDARHGHSSDAALAKWLATQASLRAIDHAIQFHGGRGYSKDLPYEQRWRDVRSGGIAHGPFEIMLEIGAQELWPRHGSDGRS